LWDFYYGLEFALSGRYRIAAFGDFEDPEVFGTFALIVFGELGAEAGGLDTDGGILAGVEAFGFVEYCSGNLGFPDGFPGILNSLLYEVGEEVSKRFCGGNGRAGTNLF
jgi:hypothetical protein